jgi:hypothetical protein
MTGLRRVPTLHLGCIEERTETMPTDETRSRLPAEWAFVVHLRPGALPERGRVVGRVEHVVSGRNEQFGSLRELLAFLGRVLRTPGRHRTARGSFIREAR